MPGQVWAAGEAADWIMIMFPADAQLTALLAKYKAKWFDVVVKRIFKEWFFNKITKDL